MISETCTWEVWTLLTYKQNVSGESKVDVTPSTIVAIIFQFAKTGQVFNDITIIFKQKYYITKVTTMVSRVVRLSIVWSVVMQKPYVIFGKVFFSKQNSKSEGGLYLRVVIWS